MSLPGKPLRILLVTQFYYPDVTACAFRMHETAQLLKKMGCEVHIIAGEPHKGHLSDCTTDDGELLVSRVPLIKHEGKGKWNYIAHYLSFMVGAIKASARHRGQFDIIWASSPPLFTGIAGFTIAWLKNSRFCLDIRDIWPESAVVAGQITADGSLFKAAKIVEKFLYQSARLITCVASPMADYIEKMAKARPTIIYNAIPQAMTAESALPIDTKPAPMTIMYIGNMGFCQNLGLVLDAAEILQKELVTDVKFLLVGNGIEKTPLEEDLKRRGLANVEIRGVVAKEKAIELICNAHALMLHLKDDGTMDKTIPSKVFDYMAGGRPILYGLKGEACDILGSIEGNLYYDPADARQLARQAVYLRDNYQTLAEKARQNLERVKAEFLRERMAERLLQAFQQLVGQAL